MRLIDRATKSLKGKDGQPVETKPGEPNEPAPEEEAMPEAMPETMPEEEMGEEQNPSSASRPSEPSAPSRPEDAGTTWVHHGSQLHGPSLYSKVPSRR